MSKLNKEFTDVIDKEFREIDYVGRKITIRAVVIILSIAIISSVCGVVYKKWKVDKDREIFKQSVTYNESAASFLADSYMQYNSTDDETERKSIKKYVQMRYPNLDSSKIENRELRAFYNDCIGGF